MPVVRPKLYRSIPLGVKSHPSVTPFQRPRMTPLDGAETGGAGPHLAEQGRSWPVASGEREFMRGPRSASFRCRSR